MPDNNDLLAWPSQVLDTLLHDHTTHKNIFWATHDYESLGPDYGFHSPILPHLLRGEGGRVVRPRVFKSKEQQSDRSKEMAEVFTPSWICQAQNNLIEEAWVNHSSHDGEVGRGLWQDYVRRTVLEITCGEAPYLTSRYDTTTGETIPLDKRIGLLDRKLRQVSEHTESRDNWFEWAQIAYRNTYGYEWQGDNLFLARQNLLLSFVEYYEAQFAEMPSEESISKIADIIAWNLWQMDGLTGGLPDHEVREKKEPSFFLPSPENCYCRIYDWEEKKETRFIDLIK